MVELRIAETYATAGTGHSLITAFHLFECKATPQAHPNDAQGNLEQSCPESVCGWQPPQRHNMIERVVRWLFYRQLLVNELLLVTVRQDCSLTNIVRGLWNPPDVDLLTYKPRGSIGTLIKMGA